MVPDVVRANPTPIARHPPLASPVRPGPAKISTVASSDIVMYTKSWTVVESAK
jgi:hypothetical protein